MYLRSFSSEVSDLLIMIGQRYGMLTGTPRFVVGAGTAAEEWFTHRVDAGQLYYNPEDAIQDCTADRGDLILVAPGYTQNLAAADVIDLDVAGIRMIGLGHGGIRPTFTYTNAAGEIVIGADSVQIANIICNASVTATLLAIDIEMNNTDPVVEDCLFGVDAAGTDEFNNAIIIGDQANRALIRNNECHQGTAAAVSFVKSDADNDYSKIIGNFVSGDYSTACIVGDEQDDMILISRNKLYNGQATGVGLNAQPCVEVHTNTTGVIEYNLCICNLATVAASIVADDCHLHENYYNEDKGGGATSTATATSRVASADD